MMINDKMMHQLFTGCLIIFNCLAIQSDKNASYNMTKKHP